MTTEQNDRLRKPHRKCDARMVRHRPYARCPYPARWWRPGIGSDGIALCGYHARAYVRRSLEQLV